MACANVSKLQRELTKYLIRWFLPLEGIVCPRYIPQMAMACDREVNVIRNERGNPRPHRVAKKKEDHTWVYNL